MLETLSSKTMRVREVSRIIRSNSKLFVKGMILMGSFLEFLSDSGAGQNLADLARPVYVRWLFKAEGVTNPPPAADNERAYMPLSNGSIVSVRLSDGGLVWRSDVGGLLSASPAVDHRNVYVASES